MQYWTYGLDGTGMKYNLVVTIAVGERMFLGVQDFEFIQIQSNLPKSNYFSPNFASILLKFCLNFIQI